MERYTRIQSVRFGTTELSLPMFVRVARRAEALPSAGDGDAFPTSVQVGPTHLAVEVRVRGTAVAEAMSPGACETLTIVVLPASADAPARNLTLAGAVLTAMELEYQQSAASATLKFLAQADAGDVDPFVAEDQP